MFNRRREIAGRMMEMVLKQLQGFLDDQVFPSCSLKAFLFFRMMEMVLRQLRGFLDDQVSLLVP